MPDQNKLTFLAQKANDVRQSIINMLVQAGSGHVAGPLDTADIFATLYFDVLNIDPQNPTDPNRDYVLLSCGHICPVWYATLAHRGFMPVSELQTLRKLGTRLQGHPHIQALSGIENTSGPLGQGLSQAAGIALGLKMDGRGQQFVYCIGSDAEFQEGQVWEAAMFAAKYSLGNLTWIIDRNNIQIDGFTEDVMPIEPLREKLESFGWYTIEIDGHNYEEIISACSHAKAIFNRPVVIIAHTIAGKGVDFMEYKYEWHSKNLTPEQVKAALNDLRTLGGKITSEHQ